MALLRDLSLTLAPAPAFGKMPDSCFLWKMPAGIRPGTGVTQITEITAKPPTRLVCSSLFLAFLFCPDLRPTPSLRGGYFLSTGYTHRPPFSGRSAVAVNVRKCRKCRVQS